MKRVTIAAMTVLVLASTAGAAGPITGKVRGVFVRSAYDGTLDQGHLKRYIKTSRVWCAWQDGKVLVHVRMRVARTSTTRSEGRTSSVRVLAALNHLDRADENPSPWTPPARIE